MKKLSADFCQNLLSSNLLPKNIKVQIYGTIILSFVLYGCDSWSPTVSKEYRLGMFSSRMLRNIFRPTGHEVLGEWGRWHNETLYDLYSSYIWVIKSRRMMGRACSTCGGEERFMRDLGEETWGKETAWKTQAEILKWIFKKWCGGGHWLDWSGSWLGQVGGSSKCSNEPMGYLLRKVSSLWS